MKLDEISTLMGLMNSPAERLQVLLDLSSQLPPYPDSARTSDHLVRGCMSRVWLDARFAGSPTTLQLAIDSDALIVQGLAALVHTAFAGKSPAEVLDFDFDGTLARLGLSAHVSPQRKNGLAALVAKVRSLAESQVAS
jgi:cysteine desulfuration protein SufE